MDQVLFSTNNKVFNLAQNGVQMMGDKLVLRIASNDFEMVEASAESDSITQMLADGTKVSTYKGFTKLVSIEKTFNQNVDRKDVPRDVVTTQVDEETGKEIEIHITVYDTEYIKSDICTVTLARPTLEKAVADSANQISEVQAMLKELMQDMQ